jgi:hypothetical protein
VHASLRHHGKGLARSGYGSPLPGAPGNTADAGFRPDDTPAESYSPLGQLDITIHSKKVNYIEREQDQ